jgi:hypothetical protein
MAVSCFAIGFLRGKPPMGWPTILKRRNAVSKFPFPLHGRGSRSGESRRVKPTQVRLAMPIGRTTAQHGMSPAHESTPAIANTAALDFAHAMTLNSQVHARRAREGAFARRLGGVTANGTGRTTRDVAQVPELLGDSVCWPALAGSRIGGQTLPGGINSAGGVGDGGAMLSGVTIPSPAAQLVAAVCCDDA